MERDAQVRGVPELLVVGREHASVEVLPPPRAHLTRGGVRVRW